MQGWKRGVLLSVLALVGCKHGSDAAKPQEADKVIPTEAAAPAAAATSAATQVRTTEPALSAAPSAVPAAGFDGHYSLDGIAKIDPTCVKSQVILTAITMQAWQSTDFQWNFAKQVFLANPQFKMKFQLPTGGDFVSTRVDEHRPTKGAALVAECTRADTCMQVAAAYKTVVPTSHPVVTCGPTPTLGQNIAPGSIGVSSAPSGDLPTKENVVQQCVRLAACTAHRDGKLDGDPAIACQKKPSTFQLRCALKASCDDVLSCVAASTK